MGFRSTLTDVVDIYRATVTQATSGAAQAAYVRIGTAVRVRINDQAQTERPVQGKEDIVSSHILMAELGTNIAVDDDVKQLVGATTHVFRVSAVNDVRRVTALHHIEADLTLISRGGYRAQ